MVAINNVHIILSSQQSKTQRKAAYAHIKKELKEERSFSGFVLEKQKFFQSTNLLLDLLSWL